MLEVTGREAVQAVKQASIGEGPFEYLVCVYLSHKRQRSEGGTLRALSPEFATPCKHAIRILSSLARKRLVEGLLRVLLMADYGR